MKILETGRLFLEEIGEDRFEDLANLLANEKVHTFFPKTLNRKESRDYLEIIRKRQKNDGISFWAVIRKDDLKFLGICGLLKQNIDDTDEIEVGYRIDDLFWGQGYGTEAAKGCLQYAKEKLKIPSVISLILPENTQSVRVAEKNGLILQKKSMFHGQMHNVYRITF
ncbi:MAG TPA: GNAT family N-acetyltransferase [Spirochaetota bacterium]|nr:GNAT family N-acetyltransferase [Spirochaetota bacterium]